MSGIAAYITPATTGSTTGSVDAKVLGFYVTSQNVLALKTIPAASPADSPTTYENDDASVVGTIQNPSSLEVVELGGLTAVYGVLKKSTTCNNTTTVIGEISLLSPVVMPLGVQCNTKYGRIGLSSDPQHGIVRLYYRKPISSTSSAPEPGIREISLTTPSVAFDPQLVFDNSDIHDKTYLAGYYDSKSQQRHVMFQNKKGHIRDYNIDLDDPMEVPETDPKKIPAGLTAIYIPENDKTYFYYVYKDASDEESVPPQYYLYKNTREWDTTSGSNPKWVWKGPRKVTPITLVDEDTQLSVTKKPDSRENCIVFTNPSQVIVCRLDSW